MSTARFANPDDIRAGFSRAMSQMYQEEVPLYGTLMALVSEVNDRVISHDHRVLDSLRQTGEIQRLDMERHGAIRVGTALELATLARLFAVMGMEPVGYYD
ncbi:2-oxoadipate dioxygenase/decarboxylase family protein, partial [Pseudomonas viridiflava]